MAPNGFEVENEDERKVASMLGALKRVEAPSDFDLRVKGRIARGLPSTSSAPVFRRWLPYAALPALLIGLAGLLAFSGMFTFDGANVPEVTESRFQPAPTPVVEPTSPSAELPREIARDEIAPPPMDAMSRTVATRNERRGVPIREVRSLSFDTGLGITNKVIQPRGIPVDPRIVAPQPGTAQDRGIKVQEILSSLGIAAEKSPDGWRVAKVNEGSQAEKSGVRISDIIEAVGSHVVKGKDSLDGNISIDSITLVRGGKRVNVKLAGR